LKIEKFLLFQKGLINRKNKTQYIHYSLQNLKLDEIIYNTLTLQ